MQRTLFAAIFCALGVVLPGAAQAEWLQASSKHFVLYSNDRPDHVRAFTTRLERFDRAMRVMRGMPDNPASPASRLTIYVVDDVADIQRLIGKDQKNVAGFYEPRANAVAFVPRKSGNGGSFDISAQQILLHEYTHHFMLTNWTHAAFPAWFVEGFAEFNATAIFREDGGVMFGSAPAYRAFGLQNSDKLTTERLLRPNPGKLSEDQTDALYARGWLLTHYLMFEPSRHGQLDAYIAAINAGKPIAEAIKAFGNIGKLDDALDLYKKRPTLRAQTLNGAALSAIGDITVRPLGAAEAAMMPAVLRSNRGVDKTRAPAVAALARRLAAPFPTDAAAQNELAEAECDAGQFAACQAAADRAIAADPTSVHALLYKGIALSSIATKAGATDAATWNKVRGWFLAANKLDTEDPQPLILFYGSFVEADQKPTKNADAALLYAYALAPHDLSLRYTAAHVMLQQGDAKGARQAIAPLAYSPHGGGEEAVDILAALDERGPAAALAMMDHAASGPASTPHGPGPAGPAAGGSKNANPAPASKGDDKTHKDMVLPAMVADTATEARY